MDWDLSLRQIPTIRNPGIGIVLMLNCLRFKFGFSEMLLLQCIGTLSPAYLIKIVSFVVPLLSFLSTAKEKIAKEMPFKREIPS